MESTESRTRRRFSPDQKFKIIKEQMTTRSSVSEICKKYDISPTAFYKWQESFLKSALDGFKKVGAGATKAESRKIEELEKRNCRMQSVISEIVQENIELKKSLGDSGLL